MVRSLIVDLAIFQNKLRANLIFNRYKGDKVPRNVTEKRQQARAEPDVASVELTSKISAVFLSLLRLSFPGECELMESHDSPSSAFLLDDESSSPSSTSPPAPSLSSDCAQDVERQSRR